MPLIEEFRQMALGPGGKPVPHFGHGNFDDVQVEEGLLEETELLWFIFY